MFLKPKKYFQLVLLLVIVVLSIVGMAHFKMLEEQHQQAKYGVYFEVCRVLFVLSLILFIINWLFNLWKQYQQLKHDKSKAELALLKSKIDPHFFFNTLNNLYGLAMEKSDKTPSVILKLSDIMRYTIYEGEHDTVSILDEVNYLEKYIEIHQIRYKKKVAISFEKELAYEEAKIAPLLFIILLENAFKHGVDSMTDEAYINIKLLVHKDEVSFTVENNYEAQQNDDKGIGIDNLKNRLRLLYPAQHSLHIENENGVYWAQLKLQIR